MIGVLLAAGSGSRIKPFSLTGSKVMLEFLGKPLLFYHIDEFVKHGIDDIVIICNRDNVGEISERCGKEYGKTKIGYVVQDVQLGPSHAIYSARDLLTDSHFLFKYGDSVHSDDLVGTLLKKNKGDGVITLRKVKDPKRYGIARLEKDVVVEIMEKPEKAPSKLGLVGAGILNTQKFLAGIEKDILFSGKKEVPPPEYVLREGGKLPYWVYDGKREDLGKPWDVLLVNRLLVEKFADKKGWVGGKIGKKTVLKNFSGVAGNVGDNSVIDGSVIMEGAVVGNNCKIIDSVIGKNCVVGDGFVVKSGKAEVFVKDHYEKADCSVGVFLGDGVTIGKDVICKPGKMVYPGKTVKTLEEDHLVRAVVFDADNTLYDTKVVSPLADKAAMKFFAKQGGREAHLYAGWKEIVEQVKEDTDPKKRHRKYSYGLLAKRHRLKDVEGAFGAFLKVLLNRLQVFSGVPELLEGLEGYKVALVSEDPSDVLIPKIKRLKLEGYFNLVLSSDSIGVMKPNEEYIKLAMQALGVSPYECVFVGDNFEKDLKMAGKMGGKTVLYGEGEGADFVGGNHKELVGILRDV
ncbi:MAG: HAD-IA family hydrolase [Candidatus Woesearchaeota archaeon]|jgi:glucose-1-phosphate thymidylyltransferase|nr:HAD-IA family hydrolase [Candidatus Woesearchaeota archaeon]